MLTFLSATFVKFRKWIIGIAAAAVAFFAAYVAGRREGRHDAELQESKNDAIEATRIKEETQSRVQERYDVEADIASRPDNTSADRLRSRWSRDKPDG